MERTDTLLEDLRSVIADAEELLRATADQAGPRAQEARARVEASLHDARERLHGLGQDLDGKVRANPWTAIGIAAAIGLVAGVLLSRK